MAIINLCYLPRVNEVLCCPAVACNLDHSQNYALCNFRLEGKAFVHANTRTSSERPTQINRENIKKFYKGGAIGTERVVSFD